MRAPRLNHLTHSLKTIFWASTMHDYLKEARELVHRWLGRKIEAGEHSSAALTAQIASALRTAEKNGGNYARDMQSDYAAIGVLLRDRGDKITTDPPHYYMRDSVDDALFRARHLGAAAVVDDARQAMQAIVSSADNIRKALATGVDVSDSVAVLERNVARLDMLLAESAKRA